MLEPVAAVMVVAVVAVDNDFRNEIEDESKNSLEDVIEKLKRTENKTVTKIA